jgi:hypothetical protein
MARQEGGQCSIGLVRARIAWLAGAAGAGVALYRKLKRAPAPTDDPRAEELRRKLEESRTIVEEREEFESAETPVDEVTGPEAEAEAEVEDRRKAVHERGRAAADEMRDRSAE